MAESISGGNVDSMNYNPDIHHRKSIRLKGYDYSQKGLYFITICTQHRSHIFGKIEKGKMILNEYGEIVKHVWQNLPNHYHNCSLDEFIIMPDHFHGIVTIDMDNNITCVNVGNGFKPFQIGLKQLSTGKSFQMHNKHGLPEIIRGFKTFSSRGINEINNGEKFHWQKSYYDHIIRNNVSLIRIRKYIINNPVNWERKNTK